MQSDQSAKKLIIIVAVVVGLIIGGIVTAALSRRGKIAVDIKVVPRIGRISIDGKSSKAGTAYLSPGEHTITARLEGFQSSTERLDLTERREVVFLLTPLTDEAQRIAQQYERDYLRAEGKQGTAAQKRGEELLDAHPILRQLPERTSYYSIDYSLGEQNRVTLRIGGKSPLGRQVAIEKIRSWGFDPTNYDVVFTDLYNPFSSFKPRVGN